MCIQKCSVVVVQLMSRVLVLCDWEENLELLFYLVERDLLGGI